MRTALFIVVSVGLALPAPALAVPAPFDVQSTQPQASAQAPEVVTPAGTTVFRVDPRGNVLMGPNENSQDVGLDNTFIPDFAYRADTRRVFTRSLFLGEIGDPADLALERAAGRYPLGPPSQITAGANLGIIYWRGWTGPGGFGPRSALITSRSRQDITMTQAGGDLRFYTTPLGGIDPLQRMVIEPTGGLTIAGATSTPSRPDPGSVVLYVRNGQLVQLDSSGATSPLANTTSTIAAASFIPSFVRSPAPATDLRVRRLHRTVSRLVKQMRSLRRMVRTLRHDRR